MPPAPASPAGLRSPDGLQSFCSLRCFFSCHLCRHRGSRRYNNGLVGVDIGGYPWREDQVTHPDEPTDFEVTDVDGYLLGDLFGRGADAQAAQRVLEDAPFALDANRRAHQHDRDLGSDDLIPANDLEIDVGKGMTERVALELASQDQVVAATDIQSKHLVEPVDSEGGTQISGYY